MNKVTVLTAVTVLALTACSSGSTIHQSATPASAAGGSSRNSAITSMTPAGSAQDATAQASKIKGRIPSVVKVVTITENNDPNSLLGRPGGYTSAAVLYEKSVSCTEVGATCGATIEVYGSKAASKARATYIQKVTRAAEMVSYEYDYLREDALLRVAAAVKPSAAQKYNEAFGGVLFH
jgi:hypothetical protein